MHSFCVEMYVEQSRALDCARVLVAEMTRELIFYDEDFDFELFCPLGRISDKNEVVYCYYDFTLKQRGGKLTSKNQMMRHSTRFQKQVTDIEILIVSVCLGKAVLGWSVIVVLANDG